MVSPEFYLGVRAPGALQHMVGIKGAKLVVRFTTPMQEYADYARNIMGITEQISEPNKSGK